MVHCLICGTEMAETNLGNYYCPNCGKFDKEELEIKESKEEPKYIG